ncbi:hypothetical protein DFP72DRAFT_846717 [Ephemerocybe angulata]|uniref:Uncharacterized protein n=1 Tax=Ephemerocybe angulata TaxID=980116 RepID=A0A8H6I008_9AGAR|nr:hypothetical protein DFP72DRAFT_846717 [Tulosesus angulatus]
MNRGRRGDIDHAISPTARKAPFIDLESLRTLNSHKPISMEGKPERTRSDVGQTGNGEPASNNRRRISTSRRGPGTLLVGFDGYLRGGRCSDLTALTSARMRHWVVIVILPVSDSPHGYCPAMGQPGPALLTEIDTLHSTNAGIRTERGVLPGQRDQNEMNAGAAGGWGAAPCASGARVRPDYSKKWGYWPGDVAANTDAGHSGCWSGGREGGATVPMPSNPEQALCSHPYQCPKDAELTPYRSTSSKPPSQPSLVLTVPPSSHLAGLQPHFQPFWCKERIQKGVAAAGYS